MAVNCEIPFIPSPNQVQIRVRSGCVVSSVLVKCCVITLVLQCITEYPRKMVNWRIGCIGNIRNVSLIHEACVWEPRIIINRFAAGNIQSSKLCCSSCSIGSNNHACEFFSIVMVTTVWKHWKTQSIQVSRVNRLCLNTERMNEWMYVCVLSGWCESDSWVYIGESISVVWKLWFEWVCYWSVGGMSE